MLSKAKKGMKFHHNLQIIHCMSNFVFYISHIQQHRCWKTYMHGNINMGIYPGVWLIKQPSKLIWKAYDYPRWPAKCHFLTACWLQYWLEVVFLMTGQMLSNCVWKVLTRQFLEPRFFVTYKSCWAETLQSCLVPLQLSNAPKSTEIFNKVQEKFTV